MNLLKKNLKQYYITHFVYKNDYIFKDYNPI